MEIANNQLFAGITPEKVKTLVSGAQIEKLGKGEALFHHGDKVKYFYIIISGLVKLFRINSEGEEKTLEILKSGQTTAEQEIMDSCTCHRMSAEAVENSVVAKFPVAWLKDSVKAEPQLALNILSQMSDKIYQAGIEAEHQVTMTAPQMVACFLQRICVLHGFDPKGFDLPYSKTLIASRLGMELETFSRTLGKLRDHGISVSGNKVSIHDLEKIERYLCDFCSVAEDCETHKAIAKKL